MIVRKIIRDFRTLKKSPAKFLALAMRVKLSLSDQETYPDTFWASNLELLHRFFEAADRLEVSCHLASDGGRTLIRERDALILEIIEMMEQISSVLEAPAVLNPEVLLRSGFSVTQERRSTPRTKLPLTAATDFVVVNLGEQGKAVGSASPMPGAVIQEIQANTKDPFVEKDWFHKGIHHDPASMMMEGLDPANTCFRMRYHSPHGPGPWSPIVTVPIT